MTGRARPSAAEVAIGRWDVVAESSAARFTVRDKTFGTVRGTIPVLAGGFEMDRAGAVSGELTLRAAGIVTGNARRDEHVRTTAFLGVVEHPEIRVLLGRVTGTDDGWSATATLYARGQSAPVDLVATDPVVHGDDATLRVVARLDRRPLLMRVPRVVVGRYLDIDVELGLRRIRD